MTRRGYQQTPEHRERISRALRTTSKKVGAPRTRADSICQACGKAFRPQQRPEITRSGRGDKYCSRSCYFASVSEGPGHSNWRGGVKYMMGYRYLWLKPEERKRHICSLQGGRYIREHTLVAEKALGRCLRKGEVVHHINCDRSDNRNSNLLICTASYHALIHQRMSAAWAREHLQRGK